MKLQVFLQGDIFKQRVTDQAAVLDDMWQQNLVCMICCQSKAFIADPNSQVFHSHSKLAPQGFFNCNSYKFQKSRPRAIFKTFGASPCHVTNLKSYTVFQMSFMSLKADNITKHSNSSQVFIFIPLTGCRIHIRTHCMTVKVERNILQVQDSEAGKMKLITTEPCLHAPPALRPNSFHLSQTDRERELSDFCLRASKEIVSVVGHTMVTCHIPQHLPPCSVTALSTVV